MKLSVSPIVLVISVTALGGCATLQKPNNETSEISAQVATFDKTKCSPKRHIGIRKCPSQTASGRIDRNPAQKWRI